MVNTVGTLINCCLPELNTGIGLIMDEDIILNGKVSSARYPQGSAADAIHGIVSPLRPIRVAGANLSRF